MADSRKSARTESILFLGIGIAILVLLNVLASTLNFGRLDLTQNKLFSLSDGSKNLVSELEDNMEITAYFTKDLPPPFNSTEQSVRDVLDEFQAASKRKITVRYVNPDTEELQTQAQEDGVQKVAHQKVENDSVAVVEGYRGLVIKHLGNEKAIPVIQDPAGLEYTITMAIKEMVGDKRPVGVLSGHEGPTLEKGLAGLRQAMPTYDFKEIDAKTEIDTALAALIIVDPGTPLTDVELQRVNQFVMNGGSLGVFGGGMKMTLEGAPAASSIDSGLNKLLNAWGVTMNSDIIADWQCSRAPMRGPMGFQVAVPYPAVPIVSFTEEQQEHPALFRLPSAVLPFVSSLELTTAGKGVSVTTLARSSENSWKMTGDNLTLTPKDPREWQREQSGEAGPFSLIVGVKGNLPSAFAGASGADGAPTIDAPATSAKEVRVMIAGTGSFMRDEFLPQAGPNGERDLSSALAFALNAIDWLAAESDLIAIRAKNVEDPALEVPTAVAEDKARQAVQQAEDAAQEQDREGVEKALSERDEALEERKAELTKWESRKTRYKWLNTLGIPALFALFGFIRWRMRKTRRANVTL